MRQTVERPEGQPRRLSVLSFAENSLDLSRAARSEQSRFRNAQERTLAELLHPEEGVSERDRRRFVAEAHQRLSSPLTALSLSLLALAVALGGQFRRQGGGFALFLGGAIVVALLAAGLGIGNAAARQPALVPLIWVHALLPGAVSAWFLSNGWGTGLVRRAA